MRMNVSLLVLPIILTGLLFVSCGKSAKSSSKTKGPLPQTSVSGPILNISLDTEIDSLDQQKAVYSSSFELIADCIDGLMQMAADGSVKNAIAEKETISPDGLVYTFNLRQDAYWSNGDPVTAHDFVYGWQRAADPATQSEYAFMMSDIAQIKNASAILTGQMEPNQLGVRAIDDYTLQVELKVPVSYFDQLLYFCTFYPANQKFIEQCGENYGTSPETYLSNGAFLLTDYKKGAKTISLIKNTAYYDASKVKLGGLHYQVVGAEEGLSLYNSGKIDLLELENAQVPALKNSSEFLAVDSGFLYYVSTNLHKKELNNQNMRLALSLAIDREDIEQVLGHGSKPAYQCIPSGFAFNSRGEDFNKGKNEFKSVCDYNPSLASEYYKKACRELGKNTFSFEILCNDHADQIAVAESIKGTVEGVLQGVHIKIRTVPKSERRKTMARGDYELGITNWGPDYADPMTYLSMWMTGNDNNTGDYSNPKYDAIIASCQDGELCTKLEERWTALKQAESIIMDEAVVFPLYQQCKADMIKSGIKGIEFHPVAINRVYKSVTK